jgi:hypothetical protein
MLFDLRGRGRRRTVQAVYLTLAVLLGGGLILFGIGGDTQGGLVDAFTGDNKDNSGGIYADRVEAAEKRVQANRQDAAAWAALAKAQYQRVSAEEYDQNAGGFTEQGRRDLGAVRRSWTEYLKRNPQTPDDSLAIQMVQVLGPGGLEDYPAAVRAMEIVTEQRDPATGLYQQLATLAYAAGQNRKGDLAADRAVELAPKEDRASIEQNLEAAKSQAAQAALQDATQGAAGG